MSYLRYTVEGAIINHIADVATRHSKDGGDPYKYEDRVFFDIVSAVGHFMRVHYAHLGFRGYVNDKIMLQERL